jgi:hypothetical protein
MVGDPFWSVGNWKQVLLIVRGQYKGDVVFSIPFKVVCKEYSLVQVSGSDNAASLDSKCLYIR